MGGNPAAAGNAIAQASLNESQRQYNEQQEKERKQKETAKANAGAVRTANNVAYSNQLQQSTNMQVNPNAFSLVKIAGGSPSVLNTLMGGSNQVDTLGG